MAMPARQSHRLQWAAAIAAVLIGAIVITTFALVRGNMRHQPVPATSPKAHVSPTPLQKVIDVPDSTPLILYSDPVDPAQLDGVTWDGKTSGRMSYQQIAGVAGPGNPQNNLFGGPTSIVDRSGHTVMNGNFGAKFFTATWSDDGQHLCLMTPAYLQGGSANGVPAVLQLITIGGPTRNVAQVARIFEQVNTYVAACSVQSDRAVVVQSGGNGIGTAQVWVVQLSSGKIVWTHAYDVAATTVWIVASRDGMYVAENANNSRASTIYGPDGKVITRLTSQVEAFSWDGTLAVTDAGYGSTPVDVISWRVGTVLWSCPPGTALVQALPEPAGPELAIRVAPTSEFQQQVQTLDLYVVGADGSVVFSVVRTRGA